MSEMDDYPKVVLPGSEGWWNSYDTGNEWDKQFPDQDAGDFAYAIEYAAPLPDELVGKMIDRLVMVQQGANDDEDWVWAVRVPDGNRYDREWWVLRAGCDYTGWDCQSGGTWTKVPR